MRRNLIAAAVLALAVLAPAWGTSRLEAEGPPDARLAEAGAALVRRLEGVASWCHESQVFLERDATYREILRFAPDHARSRSVLKYTRDLKTKAWVQKGYVEPKNWNKGHVPTAQRRRQEAVLPYRDAVLALLDGAGAAWSPARRAEVGERLVDLMPEDATLRAARGDVEDEGRWLLPESVEGRKRRREFEALRRKIDAEPPAVRRDEQGQGWECAITTGAVSVWSTAGAECLPLLLLADAAERFFTAAVGPGRETRTPFRALMLEDRDAARRWLAKAGPEYDEARRDVEKFGSLWLPIGAVLGFLREPEDRRSSVLVQCLQRGLLLRVRRDRSRGWVGAGLLQRLSWHVDAHHGAGFTADEHTEGKGKRGAEEEVETVPAADTSWLAAAAATLEADPVRRISTLLTRRTNAMEAQDVLAAYALASYLLEGRPEALMPFLEATYSLDDADAQAQKAVSVDVATLAWRVRRWALEAVSLGAR